MHPLVKHRLKRMASALGVRLVNAGKPRSTMRECLRHLARQGFRPRTVIDVGAAEGTYDLLEAFPGAKFLLIEPMREFEPALRVACQRYDAEYVIAAAGAADGAQTISFPQALTDASLVARTDLEAGEARVSRTIDVFRLDTLVIRHRLGGPFLLKIDVQGGELEVLKGATAILPEVECMILETAFFSLGKDRPLFDAVVHTMREIGFLPYDLFDGLTRPLDGALACIDVAFTKSDGRFRQDQRWEAPEQAAGLRRRLVRAARRFTDIDAKPSSMRTVG